MKKNTTNQFLIGSWVSFYPFDVDSYEYQLDQMHRVGLNFNIFPAVFGGGMLDAETWGNVEKQYAARNMYYCMNGGLDEEMLREGVEYARGKEHCIGYHLVDEPGGAALSRVGEIARAYRAADGERYPYVNLFPSYVGTAVMEGSYYEYASCFLREAGVENIEYLSHDYYPFHRGGTATGIYGDMEVIRRVAFENGRMRTHAFPQSTAWMGTRMPNIDEMRWNVYGYLAYGFKALSWFNLVCPGKSDTEGECFRDSLIYRDGTIRDPQLFENFGALNHEVLAMSDTLMKLDTVHAYHTKGGVVGVERLPGDWMITPAGDDDVIVSHMVTRDGGETYVMLFNNSWEKPLTASFRISAFSGIESLEYVDPFKGGEHIPVATEDGILTVDFRPGEGKLYRLNGALTYRVLPLNAEQSRADMELASPASIVGVDVSFPLHDASLAVALQISTNKKFPEARTTVKTFTEVGDGILRFDPVVGKYIRLSVGMEGDDPAFGWAEVRVRFAEEKDTAEPDEAFDETADDAPVIYNNVDYTALLEAIATVDALDPADYTAESWHPVQNFYDAAVAMQDGTYPQNAVTVAAWKLLDSLKELAPAEKEAATDGDAEICEEEAAPAKPKREINKKKLILPAVALAAGGLAGIVAAVLFGRRRKRKRK